jgi:hypothetical protein
MDTLEQIAAEEAQTVERMRALKASLGTAHPGTPERQAIDEERVALKARLDTYPERRRVIREQAAEQSKRRAFAGIGSPLHEALVERFGQAGRPARSDGADVVAELEAVAIAKQDERMRRAAERRAAKEGKAANGASSASARLTGTAAAVNMVPR